MLVASVSERFWSKVDQSSLNGCWLWTAGRSGGRVRYGMFHPSHGIAMHAHVIAWIQADGYRVPEGLVVGHVCDVPVCVRNDDEGTYEIGGVLVPRHGHLWIGTHAQNNRDMVSKGRRAVRTGQWTGDLNPSRRHPDLQVRGEKCHSARLTTETAFAIRQLSDIGYTRAALARQYGVSENTIWKIATNRTWRHV